MNENNIKKKKHYHLRGLLLIIIRCMEIKFEVVFLYSFSIQELFEKMS